VHGAERQTPAQVLQFGVSPALGFAHGVGDRLGVQGRLGRQPLEPVEDRA
jgi:hypothetical protein